MLTLGGSNTHTGGTVVTAGTLSVAGTHPVPITVNGGTLGGNGTVGDVVATSGAVAPGNSPGILHATDVTLNAGSSLDIQIDGVTPGTGYDQLLVSGTTTINGASLNITSSVTPPDSALFTIATNVSGVFAGMPQGTAVMLGSRLFRLSYVGGDGNDLVLIADMPPSLAAVSGRSMDEDSAALSIPISVGDDWTDVNVLTVQATSLDTSLVPPSHLVITGTGASRTLAITPAANASGTTTITVSVSDGTFTTDRTFQLTVNAVNDAPTIGTIAAQNIAANHALAPVGFTIDDIDNAANGLIVTAVSSNHALVPDANLTIGGSAGARTVAATPITDASGTALITVTVSDGVASASTSFTLTVTPAPPTPPSTPTPLTYALAEGATGAFFDTDILLANPNMSPANIEVRFLLPDGASIVQNRTLLATSRATIHADDVPGLEATAFSTIVTSLDGLPLVVERTMRWDQSGYGASSEKASSGTATTWYFAEGAQGFFSTFLLLANPATVDNVAHITWLREQEPALERMYQLPASSRTTIDAGSDPELVGRAFGARVVFDTPGMAERAMYFGTDPLWEGGAAAAGATELSTHWFLAEGATGTFFTTFVLLANPNDTPVDITLTYFPEGGTPVVRHETIAAKARMTRNIALDDPTLLSAAVATQVDASLPIVVERAQYWGQPTWIESHGSLGVTAAGLKWGLAEGRVGGADQAQTYILLANPGGNDASVTLTFLRTDGTTLTKSVTVPAASRFTVGLTGAQSLVPELIDESFGTVIESTQPIVVERSLYSNANGVIWAAGTNATGTPLP